MKFLKLVFFTLFSLLFKYSFALQILTEIDPPYNFVDDKGKPAGMVVEIVQEIQKRVGNNDKISVLPWARAYQIASTKEDVILFSMARTKERQGLFYWVGPVIDNSWIFIAKKNSNIKINSLDDAKKVKSIGVYRNDSRDLFLTALGFNNLERSHSNDNALRMLLAGRTNIFAGIDVSLESSLQAIDASLDDIEVIYTLKTVQVFIGISKFTSTQTALLWQNTFKSMVSDGTYEKIFKKYFPNKQLPGPLNNNFL